MRHLAKGTVLHILEVEHLMNRDGGSTITRNLPFMDFLCFEQNLLLKYVTIGGLKSTIITCELFLISFLSVFVVDACHTARIQGLFNKLDKYYCNYSLFIKCYTILYFLSFYTDFSLHLQTVAAGDSFTYKSKIKLNKTKYRPYGRFASSH